MRVYALFPALALAAFLFLVDGVQSEAKIENSQSKNATVEGWIIPEETMKKFPYALVGFDNEHRRVYVVDYGKWDMRSAIEAGGKERENLERHIHKMMYRIVNDGPLYAGLDDAHTDEITLISDWGDYSFLQLASAETVAFFLKNMASFQRIQHSVHRGYFVNANAVAETFLNLARPILGSFMERIEVYGPQKSRWGPKLLRTIPKDQLPEAYGGDKGHKPVVFYG